MVYISDSRHTLQIGSRKANRLDDVASIATLSDSRCEL